MEKVSMSASRRFMVYATPERCVGCKKCEAACVNAHINMPLREAKKLGIPVMSRIKVVKTGNLKFPIQCRHCENAACAKACPFGAIRQIGDILRVEEALCVGCKMCVMACPFGSIEVGLEGETSPFNRNQRGSAKKCDLCHAWRASNGKDVCACVEACPKGALHFVDLQTFREIQARSGAKRLRIMITGEDGTPVEP